MKRGFSLLEIISGAGDSRRGIAALGEVMRMGRSEASRPARIAGRDAGRVGDGRELPAGAGADRAVNNAAFNLAVEPPWADPIAVDSTEYQGLVAVRVSVAQQVAAEFNRPGARSSAGCSTRFRDRSGRSPGGGHRRGHFEFHQGLRLGSWQWPGRRGREGEGRRRRIGGGDGGGGGGRMESRDCKTRIPESSESQVPIRRGGFTLFELVLAIAFRRRRSPSSARRSICTCCVSPPAALKLRQRGTIWPAVSWRRLRLTFAGRRPLSDARYLVG